MYGTSARRQTGLIQSTTSSFPVITLIPSSLWLVEQIRYHDQTTIIIRGHSFPSLFSSSDSHFCTLAFLCFRSLFPPSLFTHFEPAWSEDHTISSYCFFFLLRYCDQIFRFNLHSEDGRARVLVIATHSYALLSSGYFQLLFFLFLIFLSLRLHFSETHRKTETESA